MSASLTASGLYGVGKRYALQILPSPFCSFHLRSSSSNITKLIQRTFRPRRRRNPRKAPTQLQVPSLPSQKPRPPTRRPSVTTQLRKRRRQRQLKQSQPHPVTHRLNVPLPPVWRMQKMNRRKGNKATGENFLFIYPKDLFLPVNRRPYLRVTYFFIQQTSFYFIYEKCNLVGTTMGYLRGHLVAFHNFF